VPQPDRTDLANAPSLFAGLPGDVRVSFELFPPASDKAAADLMETFDRLAPCNPDFISVTYGAGGSTRDRTLTLVRDLAQRSAVPIAGHLTCVGASKAEVNAVAEQYWAAGVRHIVALRGDGGEPGAPFVPHPEGYANAAELVAGLKAIADFDISVAAYPEKHPDAASEQADIDNLKRKLDAGATRALTQFFFEPDTFFRFRDRAAAAGITAPIVPGILPVSNFKQASKFAAACGASVPHWMIGLFEGLEDVKTRQLVATALAAEFCSRLYEGGVRDFHFYTLNRADLSRALCHLLGKRVTRELEPAA